MNKIIVDVDGVLRDIVSPCLTIYKHRLGHNINIEHKDINLYDLSKFLPKADIVNDFFGKYAEDVFLTHANPYQKHIAELMDELYRDNVIYIVTHQFRGNEVFTVKWLEKFDIKYDGLFFTKTKYDIVADIAIDDNIEILESYKKYTNTIPIAMDQPWNQNWSGLRVKTLEEFANLVKTL